MAWDVLAAAKALAPEPATVRPEMDISAVPVFVRVTVCAVLVVLTIWLPKVSDVLLRLTAGCATRPFPLSAIVCGVSSVTCSEA